MSYPPTALLQRMHLIVKPGLPMLMAGSCAPCVVLSVSAIGVTDTADKNKEHSAKLFEFLTRELALTEDRCVKICYFLRQVFFHGAVCFNVNFTPFSRRL